MSTISNERPVDENADKPEPGTDEWVEANYDWLQEVSESNLPDAWVAERVLENYDSSGGEV